MKKNKVTLLCALACMLSSGSYYSQVGINTSDPEATLDIKGKPQTNIPDGVLVPRFTVDELSMKDAAYGDAQNSALVFVTSGIGSSGKTMNIKKPGFYYYDTPSNLWKAVAGNESSNNIGSTTFYMTVFNLPTANYQNLRDQPGIPPLPILDGLMVDVNSNDNYNNYAPALYNTTNSDMYITLAINTSGAGASLYKLPANTSVYPFGNNPATHPSGGAFPSWLTSTHTAMLTLWHNEKLYRIEWISYTPSLPLNSTNRKRNVHIMVTRLY